MPERNHHSQSNGCEVLVKVDHVSKKFCRSLKKSLWYGVQDIISEVVGSRYDRGLRPEEFWAVNDVSFELKRGECLGLMGRNGAGKSTLLKMLNGLLKPDRGRIEMQGRVGALIELGTGFNPILTGRENIYNNGAILGFSKQELDDIYHNIVEFSELEDFINTPVQNYSSGMKARLGFSVAVHMKPDILILDEVLAVGDAGFKMKSLNKMYEMINSCAVIFVNHSATGIARVATNLLYLKQGSVQYFGDDVMRGIEHYQKEFEGEKSYIEYNEEAQFIEVTLSTDSLRRGESENITYIQYEDNLYIDMEYSMADIVDDYFIALSISNKDSINVASTRSKPLKRSKKKHRVRIIIPRIQLTPGEYSITFTIREHKISSATKKSKFYATYRNYRKFYVLSEELGYIFSVPFLLSCETKSVE